MEAQISETIDLSSCKQGEVTRLYLEVPGSALGSPWQIPIIILKGRKSGPTLGITSAIHGNELNGILSIFKLVESIDLDILQGTVVCCPIFNVPGYLFQQRYFLDGQDLNRLMPGLPKGNKPSEIYNYALTKHLISQFDILLDLHTASAGKANSLYIRADLSDPKCKQLAYLQNPHIIVQKYDAEGTLRAWANSNNISAITIEIGDPDVFQPHLVDDTLEGIFNTLRYYQMVPGEVKNLTKDTTICSSSYWLHSPSGGILEVLPKLTQYIAKGEKVATLYNPFGDVIVNIVADNDGVVIGKATTPYCEAGSRVLHLGLID